jgi:phosphatidylglycerophosphatase A
MSNPRLDRLSLRIATLGGLGHMRPAPGTWASAAAIPAGWMLLQWGGAEVYFAAIGIVLIVGWWTAGNYVDATHREDAPEVVIDEIAGQWIALLPFAFIPNPPLWGYLIAFGLFRFFDIVKPWPVSWADREIKGGWGVMADDAIAGLLAGLCFCLIIVVTA